MSGIAGYSLDKTPYTSAPDIDDFNRSLLNNSVKLFQWFSDKQLKTNKDYCCYKQWQCNYGKW